MKIDKQTALNKLNRILSKATRLNGVYISHDLVYNIWPSPDYFKFVEQYAIDNNFKVYEKLTGGFIFYRKTWG